MSCKYKATPLYVHEQSKENQDTMKIDDLISWNDVSSAIDCAMFWINVFVYCISTVTIMAILKNWNSYIVSSIDSS